jgi:hypothetical protein
MIRTFCTLAALLLTAALHSADKEPAKEALKDQPKAADKEEWTPLFDGKSLDGWKPKIKGYEFGENFGDTFRVEDGVIKVKYDKYEKFENKFGHLFYKEPYSNYVFRVEYRFVGEQVKGGPGWAFRNSGVMIHCQDPKTMSKDQDFPVSIEVQLLGGNGKDDRTTANMCSPGTHVVMEEKLITTHCVNSKSKTIHGDEWVTVDIEVRGGKSIKHIVNGEVVMSYSQPQLDDKDPNAKKLISQSVDSSAQGLMGQANVLRSSQEKDKTVSRRERRDAEKDRQGESLPHIG